MVLYTDGAKVFIVDVKAEKTKIVAEKMTQTKAETRTQVKAKIKEVKTVPTTEFEA